MATNNRFIRTGGAFFRDTPEGYQAIGNDPEQTLRKLSVGEIPYEEMPVSQFAGQRTLSQPTGSIPSPYQPQQAPPQAPQATEQGNMDAFNTLMLDMLKKSQGLNTADLLSKKRALERGALGRGQEVTPEELRTLSPGQQDAVRNANVGALRPELDANAYELEKANQSIDNFFKVFDEVKKMNVEAADKMVAPDNIIQNAARVIESDPEKMAQILAGFNDKSKAAIIGAIDYSKTAPKQDPFSLSPGQRRYDAQGNLVASAPESLNDRAARTQIVKKFDPATNLYRNILIDSATGQEIRDLGVADINDSPAGSKEDPEAQKSNSLTNVQLVNEILKDGAYKSITGAGQFFPKYTSPEVLAKYNQLKAIMKVDSRQQLKGSGAISDFEFRVLGEAAAPFETDAKALGGRTLSNEDLKSALVKARGVFTTAAGLSADVKVTDPKNGKVDVGKLTREEIDSAIAQGFYVEYQ